MTVFFSFGSSPRLSNDQAYALIEVLKDQQTDAGAALAWKMDREVEAIASEPFPVTTQELEALLAAVVAAPIARESWKYSVLRDQTVAEMSRRDRSTARGLAASLPA